MTGLFETKGLEEKDIISKDEYNYVLSIMPDENDPRISEYIKNLKEQYKDLYSRDNFMLYACYLNDKIHLATMDYANEYGPVEFYAIHDDEILQSIDGFIQCNI